MEGAPLTARPGAGRGPDPPPRQKPPNSSFLPITPASTAAAMATMIQPNIWIGNRAQYPAAPQAPRSFDGAQASVWPMVSSGRNRSAA